MFTPSSFRFWAFIAIFVVLLPAWSVLGQDFLPPSFPSFEPSTDPDSKKEQPPGSVSDLPSDPFPPGWSVLGGPKSTAQDDAPTMKESSIPADVFFYNQRNLRIPLNIILGRQADIKHMILYVSTDRGATWQPGAFVPGDKDSVLFNPSTDGQYWLQVASVNLQGKQEPRDVSKTLPENIQKIIIDTVKPIVRISQVKRRPDGLTVRWEIQEQYPDWTTFKLEYQLQSSGPWTPVSVEPSFTGKTQIKTDGTSAVSLRLSLRDRAGNQGQTTFEVPAVGARTPPPPFPSPVPLVEIFAKKELPPTPLPPLPPPTPPLEPFGDGPPTIRTDGSYRFITGNSSHSHSAAPSAANKAPANAFAPAGSEDWRTAWSTAAKKDPAKDDVPTVRGYPILPPPDLSPSPFPSEKTTTNDIEAGNLFLEALRLQDECEKLAKEGKFAEAEPLARRMVDGCRKWYSKDDLNLCGALKQLADIELKLRRYREAGSAYEECLRILEVKLGKDHASVSVVLYLYALVHYHQHRYYDAELLLGRSLSIAEVQEGKNSHGVSKILEALGMVYLTRNLYDDAALVMERSLKIREAELGKDDRQVADILWKLFLIYERLDRDADAERAVSRCQHILEAKLGKDDPEVVDCLRGLARLNMYAGKHVQAEQMMRRCLEIREAKLGEESAGVVEILNELSFFYLVLGRTQEAESFYQRSVQIQASLQRKAEEATTQARD